MAAREPRRDFTVLHYGDAKTRRFGFHGGEIPNIPILDFVDVEASSSERYDARPGSTFLFRSLLAATADRWGLDRSRIEPRPRAARC